MAQNNVKKSSQKKAPHKPRMQHRFQMREMVYVDSRTETLLPTTPNPQGGVGGWSVVTSSGLTSAYYDLASTTFKTEEVLSPCLRWFSNQSQNFNKFRILRATLVVVGAMGSDLRGRLSIQGFNDSSDVGAIYSFLQGPNGRMIDLASLSTREARIELPVNTDWKKVTKRLMQVGGDEPYIKPGNRCLVPINSANDLLVTGFGYLISGCNVEERVCDFFLEYEVEFHGPLLSNVNK